MKMAIRYGTYSQLDGGGISILELVKEGQTALDNWTEQERST